MKMFELMKSVDAEVLFKASHFQESDIHKVVASDLMSDVLMMDAEKPLLITSLATDQSLRTAHVVGALGVLIVNGKALPSSMKKLAEELDMTLARTRMPKFEASVRLGNMLGMA